MYAVLGVTGQVGGAIARELLAQGKGVRAIVRNAAKAAAWVEQGAELAIADSQDAVALREAFTGVEGVYVMLPPYFAPSPDFAEARSVASALREAIEVAAPPKVVCLSSVGAQHVSGLGIIGQLHLLERELSSLPIPIAFIRAGWFMENTLWDVPAARDTGEILSYLQPLDRAIPMVATADIGHAIAGILQETWQGRRIIEIEGPRSYAPNDLAAILGSLLDKPVQAVAVPREQWNGNFESGVPGAAALRSEMLDGFNSGWIDFEGGTAEHVRGETQLEVVLAPHTVEAGRS